MGACQWWGGRKSRTTHVTRKILNIWHKIPIIRLDYTRRAISTSSKSSRKFLVLRYTHFFNIKIYFSLQIVTSNSPNKTVIV